MVKTYAGFHTARRLTALTLVLGAAVVGLAACGSSSGTSGRPQSASAAGASAASTSGGGGAGATSQCGPKPGAKATGTPIRLGAINTHEPGTDFTDISNTAGAYFACVNANGGVDGHPIQLYQATEQTNPSQIAADAHRLIQNDHVVGMVGNSSIIECTVDSALWHKLGIEVIDAGIAPQCWSTPNIAPVSEGARFSSDGAAQYVLSQHVKKVVFDQSNVPGTGYNVGGVLAIAKADGVPTTALTENVPITDANSVAIKEADAAGPDGAVILNFTPPEALVILQAAQKLGLEDRVKMWACSAPCSTDFLAKSLGPKWDHKLFVNSELAPPDSTDTPTMELYKAILAQYGSSVSGGVGSFSEMGFTAGKITVHALQAIKGAYTVNSVGAAFRAVNKFDTGMLCERWTFGDYPLHIPNNSGFIVTPHNGQMQQAQGCTPIPGSDPLIGGYRKLVG